MLSILAISLALGLSGAPALPQQPVAADAAIQATVGSAGFKAAAAALDRDFDRHVAEAVTEENAARSTAQGKITADVTLTGDRPSGQTASSQHIVQIASASIRAFGLTPSLTFSSTDSNIPISLGIPAITLVAGGTSDRAHAVDEWIDLEKTSSLRGMQILLATLLTLAGMQ